MLIKCMCVMADCKHFAGFTLTGEKWSKFNQTKFTEGKRKALWPRKGKQCTNAEEGVTSQTDILHSCIWGGRDHGLCVKKLHHCIVQ